MLVTLVLAASAAALVASAAKPVVVGNPAAGEAIFVANCSTCHILKAAGTKGTIGPDLDKLVLSEATIIAEVTKGGSAPMGAAGTEYLTQMMAYKGILTTAQIENVAAFEYTATHP